MSNRRLITSSPSRLLDAVEVSRKDIYGPSFGVAYRGRVNLALLAKAVHLLAGQHPVLRGRLFSAEGGHLLEVDQDNAPPVLVFDGNEQTAMEKGLEPWDVTERLAQVTVVTGRDGGYLMLRLNHAIADGTAHLGYFRKLWRIYTDLVAGRSPADRKAASLPVPPITLYEKRWSSVSTMEACGLAVGGAKDEVVSNRICLTTEETDRFMAVAKNSGLTVYSLLAGVISAAQFRRRGHAGDTTLKILATVNLRRWTDPPVGDIETTNFAGYHVGSWHAPRRADPFVLGRAANACLRKSLERRAVHLLGLDTPEAQAFESLDTSDLGISINNYGNIAPFAHPDELGLTDFVVPRLHRTAAQVIVPASHIVFTYGGRLSLICTYPDNLRGLLEQVDQDIRALVDC
jgi:hypothetical protein